MKMKITVYEETSKKVHYKAVSPFKTDYVLTSSAHWNGNALAMPRLLKGLAQMLDIFQSNYMASHHCAVCGWLVKAYDIALQKNCYEVWDTNHLSAVVIHLIQAKNNLSWQLMRDINDELYLQTYTVHKCWKLSFIPLTTANLDPALAKELARKDADNQRHHQAISISTNKDLIQYLLKVLPNLCSIRLRQNH